MAAARALPPVPSRSLQAPNVIAERHCTEPRGVSSGECKCLFLFLRPFIWRNISHFNGDDHIAFHHQRPRPPVPTPARARQPVQWGPPQRARCFSECFDRAARHLWRGHGAQEALGDVAALGEPNMGRVGCGLRGGRPAAVLLDA